MGKTRVHQVAKNLGLTSKEVIEKLEELGVSVKSHASAIDDDAVDRLRVLVNGDAVADPVGGADADVAPGPAKADPEVSAAGAAAVDAPVAPMPEAPAATEAGSAESPPAATSQPASAPTAAAPAIEVPRGVTVDQFSKAVGRPAAEIIKMLMSLGELKTINAPLSDEEVEVLADELGLVVAVVAPEEARDEDEPAEPEAEPEEALVERPPVVTVMGHVDHGKSSILQQFRKKEMLSLEAGGITQAIGAYQVHSDHVTTFIDTPGHEAFTQMRARGAQVTDIAILVVAADDGVQLQTVEALDHARAAAVPIIVAVNKIDKPESDPQRVRQQLAELGLTPEDWGGDTVYVDVSAKNGTNLDQLLEMIHLVAELQELKANPTVAARGVAIEAHLDRGRGPVATLIVQRGRLKVGDPVVCGSAWCKVRSLLDENGKRLKNAGPSQPVQVSGWSKVPSAGDEFRVVSDEREAKRLAAEREHRIRQAEQVAATRPVSLEALLSKTRVGEAPELRLVVKADTQGSLEALSDSLAKMDRESVRVNVIRRGIGAIGENDVTLAQASDAIVVGFNVRPDASARQLAEKEGVDLRTYQVIYQLLSDIGQAAKGLLAPEEVEVVIGSAQVRATFKIPRAVVAGCYITEGRITRGSRVRLLRDGRVIYTGEVGSLRRFKEDVREVAQGYECGITVADYNDVKEGDVIEAFEVREVART